MDTKVSVIVIYVEATIYLLLYNLHDYTFNFKRMINSSNRRGYHSCKDVWRPIFGDESLTCEREETNEYDRNAVSLTFDDCISKKVVGPK